MCVKVFVFTGVCVFNEYMHSTVQCIFTCIPCLSLLHNSYM